MKCPYCGKVLNRVIDSKTIEEGTAIFRRRECLSCEGHFSTYESIENPMVKGLPENRVVLGNVATALNHSC